jgi:hypothetical protein
LVERGPQGVSTANLIMLGIGIAAFLIGAFVLTRPAATDAAVYARRIAGVMIVSLGLILVLFAIGLSDLIGGEAHA